MDVNIEANTNGKGLWNEEERMVRITRVGFGYKSITYYPDEPFHGELRAYFDPHGFDSGSWNNAGHGLIYTDKLWLREFKLGMRKHGFSIKAVQNISYSEQGMQGDNYVSMDVGPAFYASWVRLHKTPKVKTEGAVA